MGSVDAKAAVLAELTTYPKHQLFNVGSDVLRVVRGMGTVQPIDAIQALAPGTLAPERTVLVLTSKRRATPRIDWCWRMVATIWRRRWAARFACSYSSPQGDSFQIGYRHCSGCAGTKPFGMSW